MPEDPQNFKLHIPEFPTIILIKRIIRATVLNIWRNKYITLATIILMALILFIFNLIIVINSIAKSAITSLNTKVDMIVYLKDDADFIEIDNLIEELRSFKEVKQVKHTTKEQALEEILQTFPNQKNPFEKYGLENKLPANIQIITASPDVQHKIISFLYEGKYSYLLKNVTNEKEYRSTTEKLQKITHAGRNLLIGIIITFLTGGFLVIINGIYLAIHSRKEEIKIMKLVGASHFYIKMPFILEGIFYGTIAALLSIVIILLFVKTIDISPLGVSLIAALKIKLYFLELGAGISIGLISSLIATEKYLNRV